jgi:hypothetical protein
MDIMLTIFSGDLDSAIENAGGKAAFLNYSEAVPIGLVMEFDQKELENIYAKGMVRDDVIHLIEYPYADIHSAK